MSQRRLKTAHFYFAEHEALIGEAVQSLKQ